MLNFILFFVLIFYTGVFGEDSTPNIFIHKNPYAQIETFNVPQNKTQGLMNLTVSKLTPKDISGTFSGTNINFSPEPEESLKYFALKTLDNVPLNDISKGNYLRLDSFSLPMEVKGNILSVKQGTFAKNLYLLGINKNNNNLERLYKYKTDSHIKCISVTADDYDSMIYLYNRPNVYSNFMGYVIKEDLSPFTYAGTPLLNISGDNFKDLKNFSLANKTFIKDESSEFKEVNPKDFTSCYVGWYGILFQHYYPIYYRYNNVEFAIGPNFNINSYNESGINLIQFGFRSWDGSAFDHSYDIKQNDEMIKLNIHIPSLPTNENGILNISFDPEANGIYTFDRFGNLASKKDHILSTFSGGEFFTPNFGDKMVIGDKDCPVLYYWATRHKFSNIETFNFKDSTFKIRFDENGYFDIEPIKLGKENFSFPIKIYRKNKLVGNFYINIFLSKKNTASFVLDSRIPTGGYINSKGLYINEKNEKKDYSDLIYLDGDIKSKTPVTLETVAGNGPTSTSGDFKFFSRSNGTIKASTKSLPEEEYIKENIFFKTGPSSYYDQFKYSNGDIFLTSLFYQNQTKDFGSGSGEADLTSLPVNVPFIFEHSSVKYSKQPAKSKLESFALKNFQGYLPWASGPHKSNIVTELKVTINGETKIIKGSKFENDKYLLALNEDGNFVLMKKSPSLLYTDNITLQYMYKDLLLGTLNLKLFQNRKYSITKTVNVSIDEFDSITYLFNRPEIYQNYMGYVVKEDLSQIEYQHMPHITITGDKFTDLKNFTKENPIFVKDDAGTAVEAKSKDFTSCYIGGNGFSFQHYFPAYYSYNNVDVGIGPNFNKDSFNENNVNLIQFGFKNWNGTAFDHSYDINQKNETIRFNLHVSPLPIDEKGTLNIQFDPKASGTYSFNRFGTPILKDDKITSEFFGSEYLTLDCGDKLIIDQKECPLCFGDYGRHRYSQMETFTFKDSTIKVGFYNLGNLYIEPVKLGKENFTFPIKIYHKNKLAGEFTVNIFLSKKNTTSLTLDPRIPKEGFINGNGVYINEKNEKKDYSELVSQELAITSKTPVTLETVNGKTPSSTSEDFKVFSTSKGTIKGSIKPLPEEEYIKENIFFKTGSNYYDQLKYSNGDQLLATVFYKNQRTDFGSGRGTLNLSFAKLNTPYVFSKSNIYYKKDDLNSENGIPLIYDFTGYLPQVSGNNNSNIITSMVVNYNGEKKTLSSPNFEGPDFNLSLNSNGQLVIEKKNSANSFNDYVNLTFYYKDISLGTLSLDISSKKSLDLNYDFLVDNRMLSSGLYINGKGMAGLYQYYSSRGSIIDYSELIQKNIPQGSDKKVNLIGPLDSSKCDIVNTYKFYTLPGSIYIGGDTAKRPENLYLENNIFFSLNTSYENKHLYLSDGNRVNVNLKFNSTKQFIGKGNINLTMASLNTPYTFEKNTKDYSKETINSTGIIQITNGEGYLPQVYGLRKNNIVTSTLVTINNGTLEEFKGHKIDKDRYSIDCNEAGQMVITKKNNDVYNDNVKIQYRYNSLILSTYTLNISNNDIPKPLTCTMNIDKRFSGFLNLSGKGALESPSKTLEDYKDVFELKSPIEGTNTKVIINSVDKASSSKKVGNFEIYTLDGNTQIGCSTLEDSENNYLKNNIFFKSNSPMENVKVTLNNGRTLLLTTKLIETKTYRGSGKANITKLPDNVSYVFPYSNTSYNNETVKSSGEFALENVKGYLPQPSGINKNNILNKLKVTINGKSETINGTTFENDKYLFSINDAGDLIFKKKNSAILYEDNITLEYLYNSMTLGTLNFELYNFPAEKIEFAIDGRAADYFINLAGYGSEFFDGFLEGDLSDFSQLIQFSRKPELGKYKTKILSASGSTSTEINGNYNCFYNNSDDPFVSGITEQSSEKDYVLKNIVFPLHDVTNTLNIELDNFRKLNIIGHLNNNKITSGKGELILDNVSTNSICVIGDNGLKSHCPMQNGTGTFPNGAGLNNTNIVNNLVITINGEKNISRGSSYENEKYKIFFNPLGKMCIEKKDYPDNYQDDITIAYYYNKLKLGDYALKLHNNK